MPRPTCPHVGRPCAGQWDHAYGNASHTAELPFVFGRPLTVFGPQAGPPCIFSAAEERLSRTVRQLWTSFAAHGVPGYASKSPSKAGAWPEWSLVPGRHGGDDVDADLVLDTKSPGPGVRVEHGWRAEQCEFWLRDFS